MRMDCGPASRNSPVLSFSCPDREPFGRSGASHLAAAAYDRVPDAPQPRKELGGKSYGLALTLAVFSVVAARNSSSIVFPPGEPYRRPTSYATRFDKDWTLSQRRPALWLSTRTDAGYLRGPPQSHLSVVTQPSCARQPIMYGLWRRLTASWTVLPVEFPTRQSVQRGPPREKENTRAV